MNIRYFNVLYMSAAICVILVMTVHYVRHVSVKDGSCGIVRLPVRFKYLREHCLRSHQLPSLSFALSIRPTTSPVSLSTVPLFLVLFKDAMFM